jgi:glycosyltransferase involved in cell wall biosynthesis
MKTILATAYSIDPYEGSEAGTGWNFVFQISRFNKVIAITRKNNQPNIEKYIKDNKLDTSNLLFDYYDLPYYLRFWKRGAKGALLYFYLWQLFMPFFVLKRKIKFDIAHNINFHSDWTPTFLWVLGKPLVWGPINHHEKIPFNYIWGLYSFRYYFWDRIKHYSKLFFWYLDPFLFLTKKNAKLIISGNTSVTKRLRLPSHKSVILSQVAASQPTSKANNNSKDSFNILFIGRLVPLKQILLCLNSFLEFKNTYNLNEVKLTIVGRGPLKSDLENILLENKTHIDYIAWVDKSNIDDLYQKASVFLFPSHEGAGMVIPEALSHGLPIICFNNYGPGELIDETCGIRIPYSTYKQSITDFSNALWTLYNNPAKRADLSAAAIEKFNKSYTWDSKGEFLAKLYEKI